MSIWKQLVEFLGRHVLAEERMYRGETAVRMKDIHALFAELTKKKASQDPKLGAGPNPDGDAILVQYTADGRVWGRWSPSIDFAKILGGTDSRSVAGQHSGAPQGGTVMKRNYGGRVIYQPGKVRGDHERLGSAMDRYDVLMVAEVSGGAFSTRGNINIPAGTKGDQLPKIVVRKIAWSPAIGSSEERQARLQALISGGQVPELPRRPQPEIPEPPVDSQGPTAQPVPRQGQNLKPGREEG